MARPPKGKPLTFRPLRLDDDVWAECQRLGKEHGTINEGLRSQLINQHEPPLEAEAVQQIVQRSTMLVKPLLRTFKGPIPKPKDRSK